MRYIYKLFKIKTIRGRIIAVQLCVIIPAIILLGVMIYSMTGSLLIRANSESYAKILKSSDVILSHYLEYYRDIARGVLADSVLQQELVKSNQSGKHGGLMEDFAFLNLDHAMEKYITGSYGAKSIYLYDLNGQLFYLDDSHGNRFINYATDYDTISGTGWFQEAVSYNGYEKFTGYNVITGSRDQFSCVKLLRHLSTQEAIGMIVLNFEKAGLKEVFPSHSPEKGVYALVEKNGDACSVILNSPGMIDEQSLTERMARHDDDYYLSEYENKETGWKLIYMVRDKNILHEAEGIKRIIFQGLLITIVILSALTIMLCNRMTRPLYQLRDDIVRVGEGERYLQTDFPDDEIGAIGQEFSRMVNEKLTLSDKVTQVELKNKEAELELLQSNINPHFLYNTLDSLYWMAILHEADDVAELTKALSDVFKIALSKGEKFITVRQELDFVKSYLCIQNIRFEGKIHVDIQADERLMGRKIIKLLLQPFVENAVYHGLEPKMGEGTVVIRVSQRDGHLCFEIRDDGVGMDVEDSITKGYALNNSMERIKLVYGSEASVTFHSEIGCGVQVKIDLPMEVIDC